MTSRRTIFAILAGAVVAPLVKLPGSAGPFVDLHPVITPLTHRAPRVVAPGSGWAGITTPDPAAESPLADIDAMLAKMWDAYRIEPTSIIIEPETYADLRAAFELQGKFDLFGLRRRVAKERWLRRLSTVIYDDEELGWDGEEAA